jgi:hypothetical protein
MGLAVFVFPTVPDAQSKKHHELIENCAADQRRKSKSSSLQQQWHVVVPLHRTSSELHKTSSPGVAPNVELQHREGEARPPVCRIQEGNAA